MEPLDLRVTRPRSPRRPLAGIVFSARAVDKIRASLPGGELNGYFTEIGLSAVWAYLTGIDLLELRDAVAAAESEPEVEAWIAARTERIDKERVNAKLLGAQTSRVPGVWREAFERAYPAELRERFTLIVDLIEADDLRTVA